MILRISKTFLESLNENYNLNLKVRAEIPSKVGFPLLHIYWFGYRVLFSLFLHAFKKSLRSDDGPFMERAADRALLVPGIYL